MVNRKKTEIGSPELEGCLTPEGATIVESKAP
jgi:hypothetical protein